MRHLYDNGEGELVVANSLEQAHQHHDIDLCSGWGYSSAEIDEMKNHWFEVDDEADVPILDLDFDTTTATTKKAKEWAEEFDVPTQVATTYW